MSELTENEKEFIIYCMGVARGWTFRLFTNEVDEEIKSMVKEDIDKMDKAIDEISAKLR